jgi:L-lactate dehydrogenase complex protein LldG
LCTTKNGHLALNQNKQDREDIIEAIGKGLQKAKFKDFEDNSLNSSKIFFDSDLTLFEHFKEELLKISGECYFCNNKEEIIEKINEINHKDNLELCYSPVPEFEGITNKLSFKTTRVFENSDLIKSGISSCEFLVARFGSVIVSSALPGGRRIFSFPEIHIVIAKESQLVLELEEALEGIQIKYGDKLPSQIINIAGPSRTADIEKTLILGAHGPKRLIVIVLKS